MKKYILLFAIALFSLSLFGQKDKHNRSEEFKALMIAYITDQLELTPEESQQFWPIHNQFEEAVRSLREVESQRFEEDMTESAAEELIAEMIERDEKKLQLKKEYINDLQEVLPPQKVVKLFEVEHSFKRKMLKNIREKREKQKQGGER